MMRFSTFFIILPAISAYVFSSSKATSIFFPEDSPLAPDLGIPGRRLPSNSWRFIYELFYL